MSTDETRPDLARENAQLHEEMRLLRQQLDHLTAQAESARDWYRTILNLVSDAIYVHDALTGEVVESNLRAREVDGYADLPSTPRQISERGTGTPPYSADDAMRHFQKAVAEGFDEFPWMDVDGKGNTVATKVVLHTIDIDGIRRVLAIARDDTERMRAEEALYENEIRLQTIFDHIPYDVWMCDTTGRCTAMNAAAIEHWSDLRGQLLSESDLPASTVRIWEANNARAQAGEVVRGEQVYEQNGERRDIYSVVAPITLGGKRRGIVGVNVDVTKRNRTEEALHASEDRFRSLIESVTDVITVLDAGQIITFESPSAAFIFGYQPGHLVGRDPFSFIHPDDLARVKQAYAAFLDGQTEIPPVSYRFRHADGHWVHLETAGRVCLADPHVNGVLLVSRDVTERSKMEERYLEAQRLETVGQLAGGVAHDFNNMLTVILGNAELAIGCTEDNELARQFVSQIERAAQRASELTKKLLAFARKQVFTPSVVCMDEVVGDSVPMVRQIVGENVTVTVTSDHMPSTVMADAGQIVQVLINLAVNSRDAMPCGGELTVAIQTIDLAQGSPELNEDAKPGRYVRLSVSDNGTGMDAYARSHAFEPFFTTKEVGRGTGLGLATSHGIVRQHGGHISLVSEKGNGTTVNIYLPAHEAVEVSPAAEVDDTPVRGGSETVLLVDDASEVLELMATSLRANGYTVVETRSAESAIEATHKLGSNIDLLITDVVLPNTSGNLVADEFSRVSPDGAILFVSGHAEDAAWREKIRQQGYDFLRKPFTPGQLAQAVRALLDR